jgi:hypothetical protein
MDGRLTLFGGHIHRFDFVGLKNIADGAGDEGGVHDRAIHNRVLRQRFQPETDELIPVFRALELHGFDGAGANIQTDESLLFRATKHIQTPLESPACRIFRSLLRDPLKRLAQIPLEPLRPSHPHWR